MLLCPVLSFRLIADADASDPSSLSICSSPLVALLGFRAVSGLCSSIESHAAAPAGSLVSRVDPCVDISFLI